MRTIAHRTELDHRDRLPATSDAGLGEQHSSPTRRCDEHGDDRHRDGKESKRDQGQRDVPSSSKAKRDGPRLGVDEDLIGEG